ncbi:DNA-directed RNA polymerase subunit beta [Nocardia sp. NBC_00508]|uniref:DNA-directed RNA polymerase subunit beta n=1 Tax=Nocardia sp. NBC_00508 TaxID=2975992 RepID=UPI002E800DB0|nr:DNA-directed RNA polymerase subunit beta [Nocardia sp. NBC_00508]WUD68664.1 DNA-directed RNA polymerase subunit beta [Nocardia sp. NBC_00508]
MDQTALADTPTARCAYYRRTCDLPAGVHPEIGRIIVRAGLVGAITMPAALGQKVRDDLTAHRTGLGPIISHVRSERWTFLTRPDLPDDVRLFAEMFRLNVSIVPSGGEIALPSPADVKGRYRNWIVAPRNGFRPYGSSIVDTVRSCAKAGKR